MHHGTDDAAPSGGRRQAVIPGQRVAPSLRREVPHQPRGGFVGCFPRVGTPFDVQNVGNCSNQEPEREQFPGLTALSDPWRGGRNTGLDSVLNCVG
jgi:hypothetical protein